MSEPSVPGGGDFFSNMLGDLLRLMPQGPGIPWPFAYQIAASAAIGDSDDPNPDPRERIRLEQLSSIAELHVADVTGMLLSPSGGTPRLVPTSRNDWSRHTLDAWRKVLDRLAPVLSGGGGLGGLGNLGALSGLSGLGDDAENADDDDSSSGAREQELVQMLERWMTAMMPMMVALQVGSAAGHLAARALGQYEIPLAPVPHDEIFVVSGNLAKVAEDWSLPPDDLGLWVCVHEMVHHAVLSRPHVAERLATLVVAHAEHVRPDAAAIERLLEQGGLGGLGALGLGGIPGLGSAEGGDPAAMMEALGEFSAFSGDAGSEELRQVRAQLDALTAAISGYAEHVTSTIANRIIGSYAPIGEAMRRRRVGRGQGEKVAEQLFGLRLDQDQVDRGARFVEGVLERSGDAELARLWVDEASLPTPAEIDAPGLWLARLGLEG